jgi:hypothetical protein
VNCQFGKNLAIKVDSRLAHQVDERTVADTIQSACSVDAGDPEAAKIALALSAIPIGVLPGLHDCLIGSDEQAGFRAAKTFRVLEDFFVALLQYVAALDSHGLKLLLGCVIGLCFLIGANAWRRRRGDPLDSRSGGRGRRLLPP